jgi:hypothetical protein
MSDVAVRLDEFFDPADLAPSRLGELIKTRPAGADGPLGRGLPWSAVVQRIAPEVKNFPPIDIPEIAAAAWNTYHTFKAYADPAKYPADCTIPVKLLKHTITSKHHPSIEVLVHEKLVWKVTFDLELSLAFSASVAIRAAKIVEIRPLEECQAEGCLKLSGVVLAKRDTRPLKLGPVIALNDGIPI